MLEGVVDSYDQDEGFGVIASPSTPGGCWVHFSALQDGFALQPGQPVWFEFVSAQQDGYAFMATALWTDKNLIGVRRADDPAGSAYQSQFKIID